MFKVILSALILALPASASFPIPFSFWKTGITIAQEITDGDTLTLLTFDDACGGVPCDDGASADAWAYASPATRSTSSPKFGAGKLALGSGVSGSVYTDPLGAPPLEAIGTGNFTISFWVTFTGSMADRGMFFLGDGASVDNGDIGLSWDNANTRWEFSFRSGGVTTVITATDSLALDTWYYVKVVRSGTDTLTIYRNNIARGTGTFGGTLANPGWSRYFEWGFDRFQSLYHLGSMDDCRISDVAR